MTIDIKGWGTAPSKEAVTDQTKTAPLGLYVHIPFCVRKCAYCDFCSQPPTGDITDRYFARLARELGGYKREPKIPVDTLFIGGGTPSVLPDGYTARLYKMLADTFDLSPLAEFTVEVNPGTLTLAMALEYKSIGVNRISLGLQSIHENELKKLGRIHTFEEAREAVSLIRSVGIDNVSLDLMYGIPEQTVASFDRTLDAVIDLAPSHISVYGLIIEEGTPFATDENLALPNEDTECDMYDLACEKLSRAGYRHYEISNYAKEGCECRHNLKYWHAEEYIGIGAAAHSFFNGVRFGNSRDLLEILRDGTYEDDGDRAYEYVMMHLRLIDGFSLSDFKSRFGYDFYDAYDELIGQYLEMGLMRLDGDRLSLTERGFYVSNTLLVSFLDE